jgi:hypothetical protein
MAKNSIKNLLSPKGMGLTICLAACLQAYTVGHTYHPLAGLCPPFCVHFGVPNGPKFAKISTKKLFSGCYGPFLLRVSSRQEKISEIFILIESKNIRSPSKFQPNRTIGVRVASI